MCTKPLLVSLTDGKLHAARGHNQRYLHGVLLSRHKALSHPLYSQPFWDWKPESSRWVSLKVEPTKDNIMQFRDFPVLICFCFLFRNRVTGVYEVSLCNLADAGSPGEW